MGPPRLSYFVCGTPRAGTNLLTGLLKSTGVAGRPEEYFWRDGVHAWRQRWRVSTFADYLAAAIEEGTTRNGVFGGTLMWGYFDDFVAKLRHLGGDLGTEHQLLARFFPNLRFVFVRRGDSIAQAVSWAKAIQTGVWYDHVHRDCGRPASFDFDQVDALAREARRHNDAWRRWFEANDAEAIEVVYEDLAAAPVATTRAVIASLGIEAPPDLAVRPQTRRQSDALNAAWIEEYRNRVSGRTPRATGPP